jgi:hypothetical protein
MSPMLKPLILPLLVEEERRRELQQTSAEGEHAVTYYTHNLSSPDIASPSPLPLTPTSARNHSRYPGSASSLASVSSESLVSPVQPAHPTNKNSKTQLPDVQEEPLEREEEDYTVIPDYHEPDPRLYDCLCKATAAVAFHRVLTLNQATSRVDTAASSLRARQSTPTWLATSTTTLASSATATSQVALGKRRDGTGPTPVSRVGAPGSARG